MQAQKLVTGSGNTALKQKIEDHVIADFGEQWTTYTENTGYYASTELFKDIVGPLISSTCIKDKQVADIGSGTGRIVKMLAAFQPAKITAIEPSRAFDVLKQNVSELGDTVECINASGEGWSKPGLDLIFSFGVLHHIFDPQPTVKNAFQNLKSGGQIVIWLYGREGNEFYLGVVEPLRKLTAKLPHFLLAYLSWALILPLQIYIWLCKFLPLPMRSYMREHLGKLDLKSRHLTIYDQLNPAWAKYYSEREAQALLEDNGFKDVVTYHRHGYSWSVIGTKP